MNGNFQNNYSGGWNDVPFNGFSQEQFNYNYQQIPAQYNDNKYLPHQPPTQYADNMKLPHQTPAHYADNKQLPPQMPTQHIDNRQLPNQMPTQYVDNRQIPDQMPMQNVDNQQLPRQTLMQNVDNQQLPHQMPMQNFDNSQLLHQMPVQTPYVDTRQLPQQMPMENVDNKLLPHHMPMQNFDNRQFLHQTPAQMQYVDDRQLPPQMPMHNVDNRQLPHHMPMQNFDDRQLLQQAPAQMQYVENSQLHQMPTQTQYVDNRQPMLKVDNRPLPHQMAMQSFDNSHLLHQTPTHTQYVDNRQLPHQTALENVDNKQLPHHMPMQNFDNRLLLHQTPAQMQYVEDMQLSPQTPMHNVDNRQLPHHMPMQYFDNRPLLHQTPAQMQYVEDMQLSPQTPMQNFDNRQLLHQTPAQMQYVENRQFSPQAPMQNVDNRQLLHHMPMQNFDNRQLLDQTPTQMQYVDNRQLSPQVPTQFIDNCRLPHPMPTQYVDNSQLPHQAPTQTQYVANSQLPHQMPTQNVDKRQLPHQVPPQYVDNRQLPHQMPPQNVDNGQLPHHMPTQSVDNSQLPHHTPAQYVDNIQFPHHTPTQYVDKRPLPHQMPTQHVDNRQVPHQMPTQHVDNRQLPHQQSAQLVDNRQLPHQMPAQHVDNRKLPPHQMPEQHVDNKQVPHQMPAQHVDNRQLPHQMPTQHVDNRQLLPHQQSAQLVDNRQLPHQMPAHFAVNRDLPQQTPEDRADKFLPPLIHCDICNITMIPECLKEHDNGKIHQRLLLELRQMPESYADKKWSPQQMPKVTADKRPLPHEKPEYFDDELCLTPLPPLAHCEICGITMIPTSLEQHYNGKRHKKMLLKLRKQSVEHKTSNGEESRHVQDSQINPVVQPKKVPKFKKVSRPVENMSREAQGSHWYKDSKRKHRNHIRAMVFKNKKFLAESSKRKVGDNMNAKNRGFKCKIGGPTGKKYMKMKNGKRRRLKSSNPEVNALSNSVELPELTPSSGCVASPKTAPIPTEESSFELQSQHVSASLSQNTVEKIDQPQSTPVELNASAGSNKTEFMSSDFAAIAPPQVPATSQVFTTPPAVGSSFEPKIHIVSQKEATEAKEHCEIQNRAMERNNQPDSISTEFHAPAGSDINTLTEDSCSDSGAMVIAPPQSPIASQVSTLVAVIDTEMSENQVRNEIQNHIIVDSNDHQHLVSMELQDDPAGSITNNQTEVVNSDSTAIQVVIEPLASAPPDADVSLSCFEALTEHGLSTEMEPEVSESVAYFDSKYPTKQTNIELLPSLTMEIDALPEVSAETETEDGSSQVEVEMDVVATESKITKLPQVSVCLACGDEGFEETLVYCNKCKACSLHRYCLDGPVIFTDEVIWFCEDCEQEVVDVDYPVEDTTDTEKGEIDSIEDCMTVVYPQPIADPIWRGSLQVVHKSNDKITGLMGHLSTLACPKVLEETRHLPTVLNADLLQRSAVWPASFAKFGTNYQSIGLYFFPQNERFEKYYDQLVDEMISNDLAIRARVEKSELLIFPSTMLPNQYKRFQSKYYLWGIFKRKQAASTIKDS